MYKFRWLAEVARQGLSDMVPAVRQAFNDDPTDDRLTIVYGRHPRFNILAIALAGVVAGRLVAHLVPDIPFGEHINWPAVLVGAIYATLIRRYLFRTRQARASDYPWLAASMVPAIALLMVVTAVSQLARVANGTADDAATGLGSLLVVLTDALGVAAAMTVSVAALCYSRNWARALWDLALRLFVFRLTIWLTALIMLEIGFVGPIVAALLRGIFNFKIPEWLPELFDQLSYAALLSVVYLAVIGATWTVCRKSFGELLATGQVDILATIADLAESPEKKKKRQEKKSRKREKRRHVG